MKAHFMHRLIVGRGRAACVVLLGGLCPLVGAQPGPAPHTTTLQPWVVLNDVAPLQGYQRYVDSAIQPWREVNDQVRQIGGWRAYAREAAQTDASPPDSSKPDPSPSGAHTGHGGHRP